MDMRDFSVSSIQQPRSAAPLTISSTHQCSDAWAKQHKKPEEVIRIFYGGAFGIVQAIRISPEGTDFCVS
jgi:hypothetical protein